VDVRYSSDTDGKASFSGIVDIGATDDLEGRAFVGTQPATEWNCERGETVFFHALLIILSISSIHQSVHAEDGSRVGCGLLTKVDGSQLLSADTEPLADSEVTGVVTVYKLGTNVCFFGFSENLEPDLSSVLADGTDCNAGNGCGAHIHTGYSCDNTTTQEGHFYDSDALDTDPWKFAGYLSTDTDGMGYFTDCLETGETDFADRAFIVHANDGSRVSCGLLATATDDSPTMAPTAADSSDVMNTLTLTTAFAMVIALAVGL
jgi:hypothetical protein